MKDNDLEGFLKLVKQTGDSSFKYLQNVYTNKDVSSRIITPLHVFYG